MIGKNKKQSETIHHGNPTDFKHPLWMEDEIITEKLPGAHKPENKGSTNVMR